MRPTLYRKKLTEEEVRDIKDRIESWEGDLAHIAKVIKDALGMGNPFSKTALVIWRKVYWFKSEIDKRGP